MNIQEKKWSLTRSQRIIAVISVTTPLALAIPAFAFLTVVSYGLSFLLFLFCTGVCTLVTVHLARCLVALKREEWLGAIYLVSSHGIVKLMPSGARFEGAWSDLVGVSWKQFPILVVTLKFSERTCIRFPSPSMGIGHFTDRLLGTAAAASGPDSPLSADVARSNILLSSTANLKTFLKTLRPLYLPTLRCAALGVALFVCFSCLVLMEVGDWPGAIRRLKSLPIALVLIPPFVLVMTVAILYSILRRERVRSRSEDADSADSCSNTDGEAGR